MPAAIYVDHMRLFEFADDDSLRVKLTGSISQLIGRIRDTNTEKSYSLKALLSRLADQGISLGEDQFKDMVKNEPLKNLIANVKGDKVIFKGEEDSGDSDSAIEPDDSTSTLKSMAKRASKKRSD